MRAKSAFGGLAIVACFIGLRALGGAKPRPAPTPTATPSASASPSPTPTPSATPTPSPTPSPSGTPYVRRYFQGRLIDTPPPSPLGSFTPTPLPTTTPYVKRYFQGRPIDTPPPTPLGNQSPTPLPTVTPYVKRYFQGRPIDTPPPAPLGSQSPTPLPTVTPYVKRYFQGRPIDTPAPSSLPGSPTRATPPPVPTTVPSRAPAMPADRSLALLGDWQCTTFGGTNLRHNFSRQEDAVSLVVTTAITLPTGKVVQLHEYYLHNPNTHAWTATLAGGLIYAKASDWLDDTWILVGHSSENGKPVRFRMIFTDLGAGAYRRDFQRQSAGAWMTYAGETCRRAAP